MQVPGLAVALRVMMDDAADPPRRKSAPDAADAVFKAMFSQVRARAGFCDALHVTSVVFHRPLLHDDSACLLFSKLVTLSASAAGVLLLVRTSARAWQHAPAHGVINLTPPGSHALQTIMLLLGGFAIAAAFTKRNIARRIATWVLSRVSSRPKCAAPTEATLLLDQALLVAAPPPGHTVSDQAAAPVA